ncbi:MAG: hypothetical protein LBO75_04175, partial [Bifidobacteriaceae bacterium]|nr:hypothetical protein [Bifidobacteriaceae bacterium]
MGHSPVKVAWSAVLRSRHRLPPAWDQALERAKWAVRRPPAGLELAPQPQGLEPRVLIAPANFAGQGWAWAQAITGSGWGSGVNWAFSANPVFAYSADYFQPINVGAASRQFQRAQFRRVVANFQAVVAESGRPLFGKLWGHQPAKELEALQAAGLAVAVLWHGSDVRLPSQHAASHPLSPYALPQLRHQAAAWESTARRNRRALEHLGVPQLVSTPDLLEQVPGSWWCPVVVAPGPTPGLPPLTREVPRVVHIPSNPLLKGTDLIDEPLRRLADAGRIEYIRAEGLPAAQVRELYAEADVVADQFRLGIYGVAAVEAMAAGRLVVSDVDPATASAVKQATGLALPILRVPAVQLGQVLD